MGAHIINDVFGGSEDLFYLTKKFKTGLILMHTPAPPKTMQKKIHSYNNVVQDIKKIFLQKIKQLEKIIANIQDDIARVEREARIRRQQQTLQSKEFPKLKGQLAWPAEGRVITKFGRQWNPRLKTTTENPGVDIKGKPGSEIRTVLGGIVTTITFIRGFGTTIIIDHGNGFYTVYGHVTNIQTSVDSEIRAGDVIAYMGESGSINGDRKSTRLNSSHW